MSCQSRYPSEKLVPYDPCWPERYAEIAARLVGGLGPQWAVEHVGSTSVPGLLAKPVIDLALRLPAGQRLADWDEPFQALGWTGRIEIGDHEALFLLDGSVRMAIAHVFTANQWPYAHPRLFADWLRTHTSDRDVYARIKMELVDHGIWGSEYTSPRRPSYRMSPLAPEPRSVLLR
ncbi:GrpB family protein [Actinopolymorpha sp. B17G11]